MEEVLRVLGAIGLVLLVIVGALAGLIASAVAGGRQRGLYITVGIAAAVAAPFVLALIGAGVIAAYGLAAILVAAALLAVVVLVIVRLVVK
jgi:uncharacterized membrane protein YeaQ/YmgE (transglycosylase-associated protein family)